MAELALGLTKTAVEGTLSRVKSAIEEEKSIKEKVQNDLEFITGEFEIMQSFLNKERTSKNVVVRTWVRQLRKLAFEVEDCVEFVVHLDTKTSAWWWRLLPHCLAPPRHLDEAAAQISQLKAKVDDLSQRNTRYNLISDFASSDSNTITVVATATTNNSPFHALCEVWKATGKWRGMGHLGKLINNKGNDLQVISVWGSTAGAADLGTTPIFNKAYNDLEICQEFKVRAWVKLTTPFNPDEFCKTLLTQVRATSCKANIGVDLWARMKASLDMEDNDLMEKLMGEQRYLVILEEVTTMVEWDVIKMYLPDSNNGSRIVVSTKQLQTALFCTGKPYQVSELTRLTNNQSLCAFSNKALRRSSGKGELIWQIRCRGVISVWGSGDIKSTVIYKVYTSIMYKSKQFEEVEFERHSWVDVPVPFDLEVLARRLLLHFRTEDLQVEEIAAVAMMRGSDLTRECCRFLSEEDCLVVINGLQSTHDWDSIRAAFLSEPIRGCIIVIANEESVATHCVDEQDGALSMKNDLEADPCLCHLIKCCQLYGAGGKGIFRRGHVLSTRREDARKCENLSLFVSSNDLVWHSGVISLWGTAGAGKSTAVRREYYNSMSNYEMDWERDYVEESQTDPINYCMYSWVDVPHPFDLRVFFQLLFLDFHSYDLRAKESAAVSMMEGQDPIEWCCKFLREEKCLVVIDGLRCKKNWDSIKLALLSDQPNKGSLIVIITNEKTVAEHCADQVRMLRCFKPNPAIPPLIKGFRYGRKEASHLFSNRREEARLWTVPTFELLGRQSEAAIALLWCTGIGRLEGVISVWGIAGVGKSAIVRNVYSHIMLGLPQHLKTATESLRLGWNQRMEYAMYSSVDVPHPLNLADLSSRMLLDFHSDNIHGKENTAVGIMEGQDPIEVCRKFLCEEKCLVIIDGLQSKDDWDYIKAAFIPETTKSCIIIITNDSSVAHHCVANNEDRVVNVKGLEVDVALSLFKKKGFTDSEEKELSTLIVAKCGGIPKVITILGEYIKSKGHELDYPLKYINDNFMVTLETNPEFHNLRGLFLWMRWYFDACPDLLKPCIFYLPVFPIGHIIRRRRLVRRWIAEGYSRDTSRSTAEENGQILFSKLTSNSTAEENGERIFSKLVELSIIQQQESKVLCQVNGFFHEYIISRPMEDNLVFALDGHCSLNTQHAGQHLTIRSSWDRDEIVFRGIDFSRLRSLTVFGDWKSFMVSEKMSLVRVLDLEDTSGVTNDGVEHIVKLLPRLKFLSLRGCKEISRLPDSLGSLRQLQTLDVRNTSIVRLPLAISKLEKMQYIRAGTSDGTVASLPTTDLHQISTPLEGSDNTILAERDQVQTSTTPSRPRNLVSWLSKLHRPCRLDDNVGVEVPAGIGNTAALDTLGVVNVNVAGGKTFLKELKKLTQLRKLRVCGINGENWKELCSAISDHAHLESLSVQLEKHNQGFLLDDTSVLPPNTLKSLKLYGNVHVLPAWIRHFKNLEKGDLDLTISTQQHNDDLEYLPRRSRIRRLCVRPVVHGVLHVGKSILRVVSHQNFRFPVLEIDCTSSLHVHVQLGEYLLESTELLIVHCSIGSSLQISGLGNLEKLQQVWLHGAYGEQLKQELEHQISEHKNNPVLKL